LLAVPFPALWIALATTGSRFLVVPREDRPIAVIPETGAAGMAAVWGNRSGSKKTPPGWRGFLGDRGDHMR
jgi:hypothetical protein